MNDINKMQEYINALKEGKGYDWISRHGWELNKYELIDIVKELDYAIHNNNNEELYEYAATELADLYEDEEEDYEED